MKGDGYLNNSRFHFFGKHITYHSFPNNEFQFWYESNSRPNPIRIYNSCIVKNYISVDIEFEKGRHIFLCRPFLLENYKEREQNKSGICA